MGNCLSALPNLQNLVEEVPWIFLRLDSTENAEILPSHQALRGFNQGKYKPLPSLRPALAASGALEGTPQVRGRGAGGAPHAEQLKSSQDLLLKLAHLRPQPPTSSAGQTPGLTLQTSCGICEESCPDAVPLGAPFSNPSRCITPAPASRPSPPALFHLLIGVIGVAVTATATPGARITRAGQGLGGLWEARLPCALRKGEPASYLFPTPVASSLPGPTAFPLPPQTAGSASPTSATPRLGGAHPSYLTAVAGASECSYWGRGEREAGTGGKLAPLIGQRRCHSQL